MTLDITRFLLNRAVIARQGAPEAEVDRLALVPSVIAGPLGLSVATAAVLGRNAAPPPAAPRPRPEPSGAVTLPDLTGWRVGDAVDALTELELSALVGIDPRGEDDRVLRTDPVAGTRVPARSEVIVFGGSGDTTRTPSTPEVTVPQTAGWRLQDALEEMTGLGLEATVGTDPRGTPDRVLRTDPAAETRVAPGSAVVVFTGRPPEAATEAGGRRRGSAPETSASAG